MTSVLDRDRLGAFCRHTHVERDGAPSGPLAGLTFGAKDIFDVAGCRTAFGSPDWLATHDPAERTAAAIQRLLDAGAHLIGKTNTDELTYGLHGENVHYGTPINPKAPGRIPGGSSSGSAVAVAAELCDFALGSDTAGSVRLPSSYCGIFGMRPSHGRVALDGARPLAPSFDTAGWMASNAEIMERVGRVLLDAPRPAIPPRHLLVSRDAFDVVGHEVAAALSGAVASIGRRIGSTSEVRVSAEGLDAWMRDHLTLSAGEIWATHGEWVRQTKPRFGPGIKERFEGAARVTPQEIAAAQLGRDRATARMVELLPAGTFLCLPTAAGIAPPRGAPQTQLNEVRARAVSLLCIAGLARLPQIALPMGTLEGCPLGISLIAARGQDESLLAFARAL